MAEAQLVIMPSIALGLIIGIYEALVIHRDVSIPTHRFGHMIHALILSVVFVFLSVNAPWAIKIFGLSKVAIISNPLMLQIAIGLIAAIKIHGVSAAIKTNIGGSVGMKETWFHSLLIGALIVGSPYALPFVINAGVLPKWLSK